MIKVCSVEGDLKQTDVIPGFTLRLVLLVAIIMGGHGREARLLKHEGVTSVNRVYLEIDVVCLIERCCGVGGWMGWGVVALSGWALVLKLCSEL
jgi:hypothetical protein